LRHSLSQRHTFCLPFDKLRTNGSMVLADLLMCDFSRYARRNRTYLKIKYRLRDTL
jgi:hypothetical protein